MEMTELRKATNYLEKTIIRMEKARITKYVRRFKGPDGKWKYIYKEDQKKENKAEENKGDIVEIPIDESGINDSWGAAGHQQYFVKDGVFQLGHETRGYLKGINDPTKVEYPYFFRATNNTKEPEIGDFKSTNYNTGEKEKGVSVSLHPKYAKFNNLKHLYAVTGDIVGHGSDGEPLLKNIKYIKKLDIDKAEKEHEVKKYINKVNFFKGLGMTDIGKINGAIKSIWGPNAIDKEGYKEYIKGKTVK